ncbi:MULTISPECIES: YXWGXW repeat-containing protein [unclassified Caballeronia]|uniref:YXWGXW repeat-containing protein n=1 Tax=unclassified Caballeronia TaxID=2646786 RepID=UPI001FD420BE|nr:MULTISPECIES: YXWGXW repeat-containing protein [unclassified Caballeronia]MDR5770852.1 YXWGXW repeat-containing protein [Caballeronia sp. LZ002]MDR5846289.1 YXWGXW repeat-containing protein [Caballeronia sp. LZ003]
MKTSVRHLLASTALIVAGALTVTAASAEIVIVAPSAPPAPRHEPVPPARAGYVWDQGHWNWEHGHYVWAGGHWEAEHVGHHWVPAVWVEDHGQHRYVAGHWD